MCLWRNVKIDQRAKVYSFFKLVFMMKYSCKVKKTKKPQPRKLKFYSLSCRKLSTGAYACLWIKWHWKRAVFQLGVFVFSQRSVQKYFLYLGYLKTCINMIMQCDQAYFSLKSTLLLLAFESRLTAHFWVIIKCCSGCIWATAKLQARKILNRERTEHVFCKRFLMYNLFPCWAKIFWNT